MKKINLKKPSNGSALAQQRWKKEKPDPEYFRRIAKKRWANARKQAKKKGGAKHV